jgi:hypothetical protein
MPGKSNLAERLIGIAAVCGIALEVRYDRNTVIETAVPANGFAPA